MLEWLPFPSPGDLPNSGIKPGSPVWQADSLPSEPPRKSSKYVEGVSHSVMSNSLGPHGMYSLSVREILQEETLG